MAQVKVTNCAAVLNIERFKIIQLDMKIKTYFSLEYVLMLNINLFSFVSEIWGQVLDMLN